MFHWKLGMQLYMSADADRNRGSERSMLKIEDLVEVIGDTNHILFIHAWSDCDTTTAIYGQGILFFKTLLIVLFKGNSRKRYSLGLFS